VAREQSCVVGLVRVQLLLESKLEASLEQVYLHLSRRVQGVGVDASSLHLHLIHVFLSRDRLVVHRR